MKEPTKLLEAIVDIAYIYGSLGFCSGDSRADTSHIIQLAIIFEEANKDIMWETPSDYIEAIVEYAVKNCKDDKEKLLNKDIIKK